MTPTEAAALYAFLTPAEQAELVKLVEEDIEIMPWRPLPGPQTMAYTSKADVIGYGGAAGGGKTDLAIGLAVTQHRRVHFFRRESTQLKGVIDRLAEVFGTRDGYNGQDKIWRPAGRDLQIEMCSAPNLGDEVRFQGRPKDLLIVDEATNVLEAQVRFMKGWVRSTRAGQRKRTLLTFNPPTDSDGAWVIDFFAPWLNDQHDLYPTPPGDLRWVYFDPVSRKDVWLPGDDSRPFVIMPTGERDYDYDILDVRPEDVITPESRTFIPARLVDNPYLVGTGYMAQLQALPEPLRSQMLLGDFKAGMGENPMQVIPNAWVRAAIARWHARSPKGEMLGMGVDVARGGLDNTVLSARHHDPRAGTDYWFDELLSVPGTETPNGNAVAGHIVASVRDRAPVHIDVIGVGASAYDAAINARQDAYGVNVASSATATDKSGKLTFFNLRSQLWWEFRELLDPSNDTGIALPPDQELEKELCTPTWKLSGMSIYVESRDDIIKRIGRSPDRATAVILAAIYTPKRHNVEVRDPNDDYNPYV